MRGVSIWISDTEPPGSPSDGWIWVDTLNKVIKVFEGYAEGSWVPKAFSIPVNIEFIEDAKFTGSIHAEDKKGENATVTIPGVGTLKFKHGIMHEFTPA